MRRHAPLSGQDRAMLDYVGKLTLNATRIGAQDHAGLRAAGFDDRGILQITLIASWFNYINRSSRSTARRGCYRRSGTSRPAAGTLATSRSIRPAPT